MTFQKLFYESYITLISDINTRKRLWKKWGRWKVRVKVSRSVVLDSAIPWTIACQASLSMEFSRQEYWSGLPTPSPGDLPVPGTDPQSPTLQADSSSFEPPGKPVKIRALKRESESHSVVSNSLWPHGLYSPSNSPGQNIGMGSDSLLQGIFPTQESNQGLLHCRQILYQLSNHGEKAMATHSGTLAWKILWQRSLEGCSSWGRKESDTTERLHFDFSLSCTGEGNGNPSSVLAWRIPGTGAWWAAAYGVAQSRTRLKRLSSSSRKLSGKHRGH